MRYSASQYGARRLICSADLIVATDTTVVVMKPQPFGSVRHCQAPPGGDAAIGQFASRPLPQEPRPRRPYLCPRCLPIRAIRKTFDALYSPDIMQAKTGQRQGALPVPEIFTCCPEVA